MKIHKDIVQGTPEWNEIRKGKITASHATAISAQGKGLDTYILELMAEYYSTAPKESYTNKHMERGNELEEQARSMYELEKGFEVEQVGFVEYNEYVGCSPDGLVGKDGLVEIKCPDDKVFFSYLLDRKIDSDYMNQMQDQMLICEREWCDYVVYNPNFKESLLIQRVFRDDEKIEKLLAGFELAVSKIKEIKNKVGA